MAADVTEFIVECHDEGIFYHEEKVQELVRCKDCKYFKHTFCYGCQKYGTVVHNNPEWFCAEGMKRT